MLEAERARARARRHPQHVARRQDARLLAHRLQHRREPHLLEHVEPVVAGGAVGAERDGDAAGAHLRHRRDPRSELEVRPGAVHHLDVVIGQQLLIAIVDPHAMRRAQMRRREVNARQVLDVGARAGVLLDDRDLLARLRRVRVHQRVMLSRQAGDRFEQLARAGDREARRERGVQPAVRRAVPARADRDALVDRSCRVSSCRRFGTCASKSIMHLPIVARRPLSATASNTTSVSCTVSIVSTAVVPLHSSSVVASRAAARSDSGVCAASIGQTRVRSQSISARSSA